LGREAAEQNRRLLLFEPRRRHRARLSGTISACANPANMLVFDPNRVTVHQL
jgi:hypothetical protein